MVNTMAWGAKIQYLFKITVAMGDDACVFRCDGFGEAFRT